jgi:hypothetical protein
MPQSVLRMADIELQHIERLLQRYGLELIQVAANDIIPGSFWGDEEAGLIANRVYVRPDTPVHSLLHETCHYICMDDQRRARLDTNAEGDYAEENGVCYLQILLADDIPGVGQARMMQDMDAWGYSFRLGSTRAWFEQDADDALVWLTRYGLVRNNKPAYHTRT